MERSWIIQIVLSWAMKLGRYEDNKIRTGLSILGYFAYRESLLCNTTVSRFVYWIV